ncbi:hypothetical protein [Micromonospora sp. DT47]|uniref:hypothetical protein n=1 Tax=Micromonospora sp. DT47 TaxID=3393431 RepID=UPI003CF8DB57
MLTRHTLHQLGLLEGGSARPDRRDAAPGRRAAAARPDLRFPAGRSRRAEHICTEYSTFPWLLEPMLDAAGFDVAGVTFSHPCYGAYTCVKRP